MADQKISELTAAEAATADDLFVIVDDPAGTPVTKKLTLTALAAAVNVPVVVSLGTSSGNLATNAAACDIVDCTINGTSMISNPTNSTNGKTIVWRISRDSSSRVLTLDSDFVIVSGSITDTADYRTFVRATYDGSKWFADVTNVEVTPPPLSSGVALLLHMDGADTSTVFTDSSVYGGMSVTAYDNAQVSTAQSVFGGASAVFDGAGDYLDVTGDFAWWNAGDYTVEFWLRANSVSGYQPLVTDTSGINIHLSSDASISVNDSATASSIGGQTAIVVNTWTHIAVVRLSGTITLYLGGVVTATTSQSPGAGGSSLTIGGNGGSYYNGYIDELRIVKGVAIYTGAFSPPASPLTDPV